VVKRRSAISEVQWAGMDEFGKRFPTPLVIDTRIALADGRAGSSQSSGSVRRKQHLMVSKSHFCWSLVGPR